MGVFSNYCGLGGSGIPQHQVDEICKKHDENYERIHMNGNNPYWEFNWADQIMIDDLAAILPNSAREKILKLVASNLWHLKKVILPPREDLMDEITPDKPAKRLRLDISPEDRKRKSYSQHTDDVSFSKKLRTAQDDPNPNFSQTSDNSMSTQNYGGMASLQEQPVVGKVGYTPFVVPDYHTVRLPWSGQTVISNKNDGKLSVNSFRLNSIFDVSLNATTGIKDHKPNGRELYCNTGAGKLAYQYYRVLNATVSFTLNVITSDPGIAYAVATSIGDQDADPAFSTTYHDQMREIPGITNWTILRGGAPGEKTTISFDYNPGQELKYIRAEIATPNTLNGWTPVGSNPDRADVVYLLTGGSVKTNLADAGETPTYNSIQGGLLMDLLIVYTVQFRRTGHHSDNMVQDTA